MQDCKVGQSHLEKIKRDGIRIEILGNIWLYKSGNIVYTPLVKEFSQYKVELHPYTVRKDALPEFFTDVNQMYDALLNKSGATGVFTDFPDTGVEFLKKQK